MSMNHDPHLPAVIDHLNQAKVVCAGDIMLDHFVYGEVSRISPEAPVPVLRVNRQESMLGGSGNVVRNLQALGCRVHFFGVVGEDSAGDEVEKALHKSPAGESTLEREAGRRTTIKTRYVAGGQQLMRADVETAGLVSDAIIDILAGKFSSALPTSTAVILSDYAKGLLDGAHAGRFIDAARAAGKPVVVDPKGNDFQRYRGATVVKPNLAELRAATGLPISDEPSQEAAARSLVQRIEAEFLLITCGAAGMMLVSRDGSVTRFRAMAREVFDVSGAGDTVAAVLAAGLGSGATITAAVEAANLAAGIVVSKLGTAVVTRSEMLHQIRQSSAVTAGEKIVQTDELAGHIRLWADRKLRVGFANGCFDLLHLGHVSLLETAKTKCDHLVVAINSDESVRRLKGPGHPIQDQTSRALVLASMQCVDTVVIFDEDTPIDLISTIQPKLLVKGGDYRANEVVGADLLPGWGGELLLVELVPGHSTSRIVSKISSSDVR
jgi:D-beta-D-heptose 7-phosphate kinase/D-beta-D-heptose 1-phosphate adenosyltransferase